MPSSTQLPREFYAQPATQVARQLLGMRLVRLDGPLRLSGIISEAEAYQGEQDQACHARAGFTKRTAVMYGPPGHAYVYFTYGNHWMLNFVTQPQGDPSAVLIRAIFPEEGLEVMGPRRAGQSFERWTDGPGKLCKALDIDGRHNGLDLCAPQAEIFVEWGESVPDSAVTIGPRVGLNNTPEPWKSMPWRFKVKSEV